MAVENGFLALGMAEGEWVYVDGPCVVKVMDIRAGHLRLYFKADPKVKITRAALLNHEQRHALGMARAGYVPAAR